MFLSLDEHPLLERDVIVKSGSLTRDVPCLTVKPYQHDVIGSIECFEARIYTYETEGFLPYLVVIVVDEMNIVIDLLNAATLPEARASAQSLLGKHICKLRAPGKTRH